MIEEENIEEQPSAETPQLTEKENIPEGKIKHTTINTQYNEENMEVHKHPHHVTHKKKWGEYLLEFYMILNLTNKL